MYLKRVCLYFLLSSPHPCWRNSSSVQIPALFERSNIQSLDIMADEEGVEIPARRRRRRKGRGRKKKDEDKRTITK